MTDKLYKLFIVITFIMFLFFYFFGSNIYPNELTVKKDLTIEQINKFEQDVKEGKEIDINDYIVKEKDYNNTVTKINSSISSIIEFSFKKIFNYLLKNIDTQ